jgi:16S rRNA (adenine1518-N6/adenine1519-N6)-dimethyltransferase
VPPTSTVSSSPRSGLAAAAPEVPDRPAAVAAALEALGVRPSRRFGQSFLVDAFAADAEAALVETAPGEPVLEIGGGLGVLTQALLRRGTRPLYVLEKDRRLAAHLERAFGDRVRVVVADALTTPLPDVRAAAGNLPFAVATPILLRLFRARVPRVVALVQREVADRLTARPGSRIYGRLSVTTALFGEIEPFQVVPASAFYPVPAVDARIVRFTARREEDRVPSVDRFERLLAALFSSRRKQLGNILPRVLAREAPGADPDAIARRAGWLDDWRRQRPEELDPEAFFALARELGPDPSART